MDHKFKLGDKVRVFVNRDGKKWEQQHRGIVVKVGTTMLNVYDPRPDSGDTSIEYAQPYAIESKCQRIEKDAR